MAIIPDEFEQEELLELETTTELEPLKTYKLSDGKIEGFIDNVDAIKQYIEKAIRTARNHFLIYDDQYGCEIDDLIGANITSELMEEEIPRLITEAIIYHDWVSDVTDFEVINSGDAIFVSFTVQLVDGDELEMEVDVNAT